MIRALKNIALCIRFPFLYPRHRFTGLHYNNWVVMDWIKSCNQHHVLKTTNELKYPDNISFYIPYFILICDKQYIWFPELVSARFARGWDNPFIPFLKCILDFFHNYVFQIFHCVPSFTELDAMPDGWRKAFGLQMCKDIKKALLKDGGIKALYAYRIMDIKEKYGSLRWYDSRETKSVYDIILKYEEISYGTCIICGNPAIGVTNGWIEPYCEKCVPHGVDINNPKCFEKFNN